VGVLTNPDSQRGRGQSEGGTAVADEAATLLPGTPILKPERLGPEARAAVEPLGADILVSFAYGRIFGPKFLGLFPKGGLNVHPSLLPRWRGCAPIQSAILHRDERTGVCVQRLALGMDEGDILAKKEIILYGRETAGSLSLEAAALGAELLAGVLSDIGAGREKAEPQATTGATYSSMIQKEDGLIDWKESAAAIEAKVRAYDPWPLAFTSWEGSRLIIHEARALPGAKEGHEAGKVLGVDRSEGILVQTGEGRLALVRLQIEKKKAMNVKDFLNGARGILSAALG
jgi:methionyl-tRNA formyltransferase